MPYIKSHSNYVLKKRHQNVNGGTIYERDITTIGGRNSFSKGQVPLYQSGNFVITVNNEDNVQKSVYSQGWEQNDNGEVWTLKTLDGLIKDETGSEDQKIVLKQDYYNLRDFAYFGSCSELIRASISDILKKFPGELFVPYDDTIVYTYKFNDTQMVLKDDGTTSAETISGLTAETTDYSEVIANNGYDSGSTIVGGIPVFYYNNSGFTGGSEEAVNDDGSGNTKTKIERLGGVSKFLVDNPFNIDIHTAYIKDSEITQENFLKYFADEGYKNYEAIDYQGKAHKFTWSVNNFFIGIDDNGNEVYAGKDIHFCVEPNASTKVSSAGGQKVVSAKVTSLNEDDGSHHHCLGNEVAEITIKIDNGDEFVIEAWVGNNNKVYYLVDLKEYPDLIVKSSKDFSVNSTVDVDYNKQEVGIKVTSANEKLNTAVFKYRLRPKVEFMDEFIKNLDSFEKILMNRETTPKYTATFNVIRENDFGYFTDLERFTFPTTYGGYNIGSAGPAYDDYVGNLADIAEFYDERFCDNMYRSMTHESIKNFDWTYLRHRTDEDEEDVKQSGDKVAKIIRLFGRQFDEILAYVDNIKNYNAVTYDNINNLPDYFFTDALDGDGWDVKQIIPYTLFEYTGNSKHSDDVSEKTTELNEKSNSFEDKALHRLFTPDTSFTIKPYTRKLDIYADGYFFGCLCGVEEPEALFDLEKKNNLLNNDDTSTSVTVSSTTKVDHKITSTSGKVSSTTEVFSTKNVSKYRYFEDEGGVFSISPTSGESAVTTYIDYGVSSESAFVTTYITSKKGKEITGDTYIDCSGTLRVRIKNYSSENDWTMPAINNEFMKRLIINSKNIWRHKGTQEGVEMILGMFGMKSKRWYDALPKYEKETYKYTFKELSGVRAYDYEIKEYTSFTKRIEDTYIESLGDYKYNWINQSKNISYGTDEYVPYQGIPVTYRDTNDGKRYLYPNFQKDATYDGNPYYQMNGGWLSVTPYLFDKDDNLVIKKENSNIYNETLRNIRSVNALQDLFEIPLQNLNDGDIVYVTNISGEFAVVDGRVYPLEEEYYDDKTTYRYFTIEVMNSSAIIGNAYFNDYVIVSDPYSVDSKRRYGLADGESDGISIKVYLIKRESISGDSIDSIYAYSDEESVSTFTVFKDGKYMDGEDFTNYFRINDTLYSNELSILGWEQLKTNDYDYYKVNSEKDYYFGNNPHTGHLHYDNGHEYFTYFRHLFRYAYNNSLFNEGVLSEYPKYEDEDLYEDIDDFGFKSLINDDSCQLDYEDFLTEDSKIHYFGNYYNEDGSYEYSLDDKPNKYEYNLSTINPKTIGVEPVDGSSVGYGWMPCGDKTPIDGVTNQIVNNKVVKVIFYIRDDNFYSKTALEEIKYLESVVVPYMTQMMPSGVILGTEYRFVGQGVHSYTIKTVVKGEPVDGLGVWTKDKETNKWEFVGYTEQGVLTFEKEGDMGKIKVGITSGETSGYTEEATLESEETTLDLSTYYVASDYNHTSFDIGVITSYKKISFETTEGEVEADDCLEFNGEMITESPDKYFRYEIGDGWIEDDVEAYKESLSESGGTISLSTDDNNSLDDRDAKIIVTYNSEEKEVQVHQYGNREEVTYTVISNVNDGVYAYFCKDSGATELDDEKAAIQFKNGVAEYSKYKVSATTLYVKIEGGLPDSSVTYTLDTKDGSREDVLSGGEIPDWSPNFVSGKTINRYTWDDNPDLDKREYSSATTFSIGYDETVEKNYTIMKPEFTGSGVTCILQKPSVDWVAKDCDSCYTSNISANTYNGNRSTVLRYYINEDKSVFLDYKITQGKGEYVFKFNTSVSAVTTSKDGKTASVSAVTTSKDGKTASATTDFTEQRLAISLSGIDSYVTSSDTTKENKVNIDFIASVRDSNVKCTIEGGYVCFYLDKNTCTKSRSFTAAFIQKRSNKRIILTVTQSAVICDVGDVYCYDISNGNYYFVDVLNGDTIGTNARPIGITIIPMDNGANTNGEFARIISLTEKNSQTYQSPLWKKSDTGKAQTNDKYEYKWRISSRERVDEDWWVSLGTEGYANTGVLKYKTKLNANGLYYAKTDHHADKPMTRDSNGHYKINKEFKEDVNIGDSRHKNCLCDFMGFQKTKYAYEDKDCGGEIFEMCRNYETVGTNKGDWFLGGAGEMACLVQNIGLINKVISKLQDLNYSVTKFNFDFQPDNGYFKGGPNHGYYCEGYYWTVTNHGRVGGIDSIKSIDPKVGNEFSSWMVALANGTMQWGVHRTGHDQSAGRNQTRARARLMLLVDAKNNHGPSELTNGE